MGNPKAIIFPSQQQHLLTQAAAQSRPRSSTSKTTPLSSLLSSFVTLTLIENCIMDRYFTTVLIISFLVALFSVSASAAPEPFFHNREPTLMERIDNTFNDIGRFFQDLF